MTADQLQAEMRRVLQQAHIARFTGKISVDINLNTGGISSVHVSQSWRLQNDSEQRPQDLTRESTRA